MNDLILDDVYDLITTDITPPDFPQGVALLKIKKCEVIQAYGTNNNKKVKFTCEDEFDNTLIQTFTIKNGISNNLGKFICEALGFEPEGQFNVKELEGKEIKAAISHYYMESGYGYANIVFCEPIDVKQAEVK